MSRASRDRFSIDLQGLKQVLLTSARMRGVSPSELIRKALAIELDRAEPVSAKHETAHGLRVRVGMVLTSTQANALRASARSAGMPIGDFVASLLARGSTCARGERPVDLLAALTRSCAALTSLSRDLRQLSLLLARGSVEAARQYRDRLDGAVDEIRAHLRLAAAVLAELKHFRRETSAPVGAGQEQ